MRNKLLKAFVLILILAMTSIYCLSAVVLPSSENDGSNADASFNFDANEIISQLKADLINSINKDLLKTVSESRLTGAVNVIITLSNGSLVSEYNKRKDDISLADYLASAESKAISEKAIARQQVLANELVSKGLTSSVKYHYTTIMDGIYVSTTYEKLAQICSYSGVERVILSDSYLPAIAVENPVHVDEDTGIFDSSYVDYTGKGTVVAILDTGCDYTHAAFTTHNVQGDYRTRQDLENGGKFPFSSTIAYSYDPTVELREVYYGNITKNKIWFGYDYADKDPDVMPFNDAHGTHVAGIIGGKDNTITGVAVDTQFAIMKVFSDYKEGADDGDIMAALEDCVKLGVDAINMSLGSSCGYTIERDVDKVEKNRIYDSIQEAGISLICAASNDYSSAFGSEFGNTNKVENPDSGTVGAPSTYDAALSVASINGNKDKYMLANNEREIFFLDAYNQNATLFDFFEMLKIQKGVTTVYDYVTVPGYGASVNYAALDVKGKIALVKRGDISFEDKVLYAANAGAKAIIIYNNVYGDINMTVGNNPKIPVVSISKDEGEYLAQFETGTLAFDGNNLAGPFMSDFSSWGPTPDLKIKPEITAHGGNIYSSVPGGGYDKLSGTSMAAPNMTGIIILIRQYVKDNYPELSWTEVRDMVNELCMSTATIALDKYGNPYSPRKQGAGIADILKATTTKAFLYTENKDGTNSGKTKLELGDDPTRSGVYVMSFKLVNLSKSPVSYEVGNYTMTESLSADKKYVAERAYMLSNTADFTVTGGTKSGNTVTVQGGKTAKITVIIKLSAQDKAYINSSFPNGMYVEGFVTLADKDENGVDLNVPFLAFYGDWSDAPIFDRDYYEVETEAHNNAIDDDDKIKADYYATTPLGLYYYDYILPLGTYLYTMSSDYQAIPATQEHAALSYFANTINGIYAVYTGLLRGARELSIEIVDTDTGRVVWSDTQYNAYKSHASGGTPIPYVSMFELDMMEIIDSYTVNTFGANNAHFEVRMSAKLDWDGGERNVNDTYTFSFYIDYEPPTITDSHFYTKYNTSTKKTEYYVDLTVYDNHYAMAMRPIAITYQLDENGNPKKNTYGQTMLTYRMLSDMSTPIYQETRGSTSIVTIEITDYLDAVKDTLTPDGICFYIEDYALNAGLCYVPFPEIEATDLEFSQSSLTIDIGQMLDLTNADAKYIVSSAGREIDYNFLSMLTWTVEGDSVQINNGIIEGICTGTSIVKFESQKCSGTIEINVTDAIVEDSTNRDKAVLNEIGFSSYLTTFAFNSDIDYSYIGETGDIRYFDGSASISFYPSESVQLNYYIKPWNLAQNPSRYTLTWSSSNSRVATVDQEGNVKAIAEGRCQIFLRYKDVVTGRTSTLQARCDVEVKSEFIIENRTLIAYKGNGGVVEIPDDEGIMFIGSFAFSHYLLDNARKVDDRYDLDKKKDPLGANANVKEVIIPDGVEEIQKYAFYGLKGLETVRIRSTNFKTIREYAFYKCTALSYINLDEVDAVSDSAFQGCDKLDDIDLDNVSFIGKRAFKDCTSLTYINLNNLRRSGEEAFAGCSKLDTVQLGQYARISEGMFKNSAISSSLVIYSDVIPDEAFSGCTKLKSVEFKSNLTYLGNEAFYNCSSLNSVKFNGDCEVFGDRAFYGCRSLASLKLPNCNMVWGDLVFQGSGLRTLTFQKNSKVTQAGMGVFFNLNNLTIDVTGSSYHLDVDEGIVYESSAKEVLLFVLPSTYLGDYQLPDTVIRISDSAFSGNTTLTSFTAGANLHEIGIGAFANCGALTSVTLPTNVNLIIGDYAFAYSSSLKEINLEGAKSIGEGAFQETSITEVKLTRDEVEIGEFAFAGLKTLTDVTIGDNAKIGAYAFATVYELDGEVAYNSGVSVVKLGNNVVIGEGAFAECNSLVEIDLSNVETLGKAAFWQCLKLEKVTLTSVTKIGDEAFLGCASLVKVEETSSLTEIGAKAFYPITMEAIDQDGDYALYILATVPITTINLSSVKVIGESAFWYSGITEANLINAEKVGEEAFYYCRSLKTVTFGPRLKRIEDAVFGGCTSLEIYDSDLQYVEWAGFSAFFGTKLPKALNLTNIKYIGTQAFCGPVSNGTISTTNVETVNAPRLTEIGTMAFAGASKLTTFNAPKLQKINASAFYGTAITELELPTNFQGVTTELFYGAMGGASKFEGFYVINSKGEKDYNYKGDTFVLDNGVLYTKLPNGYLELSAYPMGKQDTSYTVLEKTVRIDYRAAFGNPYISTVTLPATLKSIGNFAFAQCTNLKTVVFRSYYAPTLEGTLFDVNYELDDTTRNNYNSDKLDILYKYDFYYRYMGEASYAYGNMFLYSQFVAEVTNNAANITYIIPDNSEGYYSPLYRAYFNSSPKTSGATRGRYVLAFIEAMERLPDTIDRFATVQMDAVITAYNMLMSHKDEILEADVDVLEQLFERYRQAVVDYHVDTVTHIIAKLYDMHATAYSYNTLKAAFEAYNNLTDEEKALITNASVLDTKFAELEAAMGQEVDFSREFEDYDLGDEADDDDSNMTLIIVLSSVIGALVIGVAVFVTVWLLKKKKATATQQSEEVEQQAEQTEQAQESEKIEQLEQKQEQLEQQVEQLEQQKPKRKTKKDK